MALPDELARADDAPNPPGPEVRATWPAWVHAVISLSIGLIIWEIVGRFIVTNRLFFAPLSDVLMAMYRMFAAGTIYKHLYVSASEFLMGFGLAVVIGIAMGILMGVSSRVSLYMDPWISALYATPLVALTPFFILIFGIGITSKAALVFTLAVFPVLINTYSGIRAVEKSYLEVADSFSATSAQKITKVIIPWALPFVITGLRLASGRALTAVVVGELFFANAGVGYVISISSQTFNSPNLFAGVLLFSIGGVLITALLERLERKLAPWRSEA